MSATHLYISGHQGVTILKKKRAESYFPRTNDGGKNWRKISGGPNNGGQRFTEVLAIDEESPHQIYAGTRGGDIYSSDDAGESWRLLDVKVPSISDMKRGGASTR